MASNNLVLQLLITAKDEASAAFGKIFGFLDKTTSATANLIREQFSNLFSGGLTGAAEFEAQLDKVAAKGGYTADEMKGLTEEARKVAAQFGVTGTEAAQGLEILAAAGLSAKDAIATLPVVLSLAKSEGISLDSAATKLSDSLSIMGLGFDQAGRMADVLAKGANLSTTSAAELADALANAGGLAKAFGLDLEQTVAVLDLLAKNGIKGAAAGTSLAAILTQLQNPASTASKALDGLGITTRDLGDVLDALKAKGASSETAIIAFGETAGPGLRALIGEGSAGMESFTGQLRDASGAAQQAADAMGGNFKTAVEALSASWETVKQTLAEPLLEPLAKAAKALSDAFIGAVQGGAFSGLTDAIKTLAKAAGDAATVFIKAFDFKAIGDNVNGFVAGAVNVLSQAMNNLQAIAGGLVAAALIPMGLQLKTLATETYALVAAKLALARSMTAAEIAAVGFSRVMAVLMGPAGWVLAGVGALTLLWKEQDKTKEVTDALTDSTEDYTKKLKEQTETANKLALIKLDEGLAALQEGLAKTTAAYDRMNGKIGETVIVYDEVSGVAKLVAVTEQTLLEKRLALEKATANLAEAEKRRALIIDELKAKQEATNPATVAAEAALGKYRKAVEEANAEQAKALDILSRMEPGYVGYAAAAQRVVTANERQALAQSQLNLEQGRYNQVLQDTLRNVPEAAKDTQALAAKVAELKPAVAQSTEGMKDWNGMLVKSHEGTTKLGNGLTLTLAPLTSVTEKTAEYNRQIKAGNDNAADWRSGMELNGVVMLGLRDAAQATADKLAYLQSIKATLPNADEKIAQATAAANAALSRYNIALSENIDQQERKLASLQRANNLDQKSYDLRIQQVRAEGELAQIKGDSVGVMQAENDELDLQIEKLSAATDRKTDEIAAYTDLIEATRLKLAADGELNASDQDQLATMADTLTALKLDQQGLEQTTQSTLDLAEAKREQKEAEEAAKKAAQEAEEAAKKAAAASAESAAQLKAAGDVVTGLLGGWSERLAALSPAARAAFDGFNQGADSAGDSLAQLKQKYFDLVDEMGGVQGNQSADRFIQWTNAIASKALAIEEAFLAQKIAVESAADTLADYAETGQFTAQTQQAMNLATRDARDAFGLLNDADLDNLQSALDATNNKLREMQDEAESARQRLLELDAEIAAESGDTARADQLKLDLDRTTDLAEAERALTEARAQGNKDAVAAYTEQLAKLEQLYALKQRNLTQDLQAREQERQAASASPSTASTASSSTNGSLTAPERTFALNLNADGQTLKTVTDTDPTSFLTALTRAQRSAT
jgi:TP901 family phage tail tape measure protein